MVVGEGVSRCQWWLSYLTVVIIIKFKFIPFLEPSFFVVIKLSEPILSLIVSVVILVNSQVSILRVGSYLPTKGPSHSMALAVKGQ